MNGSAITYFFKGDGYLRYNIATDFVDVGPVEISKFWTHLPAEFQSNLDAVVNWGNGKAYFFKGDGYLRYNIATDFVDVGPVEISKHWTHLPAEFQSNLDAVVNWGNGKAYFFKGDGYLRYNIATDFVDVGPVEISKFWTHLPAEFQSNLDAVVNWGNGKAYFFKGDGYLRYNIATDFVDVGPVEISKFWTHLPAEFQADIGAVVNWTFPLNLADLMRAAGLDVIEEGDWIHRNRGNITPVGIMMHHSKGNGAGDLGVVIKGRLPPDPKPLVGPLANFYVDRAGRIHIISGQDPNQFVSHGGGLGQPRWSWS